jgi:hypothetical protein
MNIKDVKKQIVEAVESQGKVDQRSLFKEVDSNKNSPKFRESMWQLVEEETVQFTETYGLKKGFSWSKNKDKYL